MSFCRSCRQTVLKSNLYVPLFLPSLSRSCVLRSPSHVLRLQPSFVMHEEQSPRLRSLWEGGDRSTPVPASFLFSFPVVREAESSPSLATCPCPRARPRCGVVLPPPTLSRGTPATLSPSTALPTLHGTDHQLTCRVFHLYFVSHFTCMLKEGKSFYSPSA